MQNRREVAVYSENEGKGVIELVPVSENDIPESLNGESGFHVYHVRRLTEMMLHELAATGKYEISEEDIRAISIASSLHDIGKMRIPKSILDYPGRLAPVEYDIIKKHAVFGAEIIEGCDFSSIGEKTWKYAMEIARYHHERHDGTGYPEGLVGDAIPVSALAVSISDTYDALTSSRSYKEALSNDVAIQMISSGMCGVFSETLIECLIKVVNHDSMITLRELLYKNKAVVAENKGRAPKRVLCIGNTEYLTKEFIDETFPESKVTVVGNTDIASGEKLKLFTVKKPPVKNIFETYAFDAVVYFSGNLSYRTTEPSDSEDLREVLEYAKASGKEMKILFVSSLDSVFRNRTDRAVLSEAKENLCSFYAKDKNLSIKVVQIPYLYSGSFTKDFLYNIFEKASGRETVYFDAHPDDRMHFISLSDLSGLISRIIDNWNGKSGVLSVADDFDVTFSDFAKRVSEIIKGAKFSFTGAAGEGKLEISNRGVRSEYGWFSKISIIEDLEEEYEKYLDEKREKEETFAQKVRRWVESHSIILKTFELIILFIFTEFLMNVTDSAVIFSIVDFRMAYIVIMATVHGLSFGLLAATLSSASWLFAKVESGTSLLTVFYEPSNWLAFVFFFLVGAVCGYIRLHKDDTIRFVTEQNRLLEDKLVFTREIYEDTYREKRDLKKQIIGSKDSFGKIFDITRKLNTVAPQMLYLRIIETFEEILENRNITVYSVNKGAFGRLEVASRDIIGVVSRSISIERYRKVIDSVSDGEIWRNTDLEEDYPMYAAGVYRDNELVLLIFLWHADIDQQSLYYVNLFRILRDLVQMSLLRALDYNQAVYEKKYIENTHIMREKDFSEAMENYVALSEKKISSYVMLEIETEGRSFEEMDRLLQGKIRANDIIGESSDGKICVLLSQASEKDLPFILPRFEGVEVKVKIQ